MLSAVASAAAFGVLPIFARQAYSTGVTLPALLSARFGLAAAFFWVLAALHGRPLRLPPPSLLPLVLLTGFTYTAESAAYFTALRYIPASVVALLLYTYPVVVTWGEARWLGLNPKGRTWLALAGSTGGVLLVIGRPAVSLDPLGVALGLGAAVLYAGYVLCARRLLQHVPTLTAAAYLVALAALAYFLLGAATNDLQYGEGPSAWASIAATALISTVVAISTSLRAIDRLGATAASIISTLEPVVTAAAAWWWLGEPLDAAQWMGGGLILAAAILVMAAPG